MRQTRIVVDSSAELDPQVAEELGIAILPLRYRIGAETVTDAPEMHLPAYHESMLRTRTLPQVLPPSAREFREVYASLEREADSIVSLHVATLPCNTFAPAQEAALSLLGSARIEVIDTGFMGAATGAIATAAARAAQDGADGGQVIRLVRGLIPHTYTAFYVDSMATMKRSGALHPGDPLLAASSTARPLFLMEEGAITQQFRVRKKGTPLERLVEFVGEFLTIERLIMVHSGLVPEASELRDALAALGRAAAVEEHIYGPATGALLGPRALGVVVIEGHGA